MTDEKTLTVADFKNATVYSCGLENRDPQRGYRRETPVQETPIAAMINEQSTVRVPDREIDR